MGKKKGTKVGNFLRALKNTGISIAPSLLDIASKVTGIGGLSLLGDKIRGSDLSDNNKLLALKELDADISEAIEITERWKADLTSDSWMAKNIRPLTLAFLTLSLTAYIILDSSNEGFEIKNEWIDLLSSLLLLVYGAYFGMRGIEKIQKIRNQNKHQ